MKVRFQHMPICADPPSRASDASQTIDFRTAHDVGLAGLNDATVLAIAADEGRLLVSHDISTMPQRFARCRTVIATWSTSFIFRVSPLVFFFVLFISFRRTLEKKKGGKFRDGKQWLLTNPTTKYR